jgi:hypothetical protein
MRARWCFGGVLVLLACLVTASSVSAQQKAPASEFDRDLLAVDPAGHIKMLSSWQSRYTGYPGCDAAGKYIADRFREIGLANVEETPFQVVVPIVPDDERWGKKIPAAQRATRPANGATLTVGGREIPLYCVLPNYVRTSMTSEDGITGSLIWGGEGNLADFNGQDVGGSIVLMDFNSTTRWLNAAKLGARAIVFLEPEHPFRIEAEQKYSELPIPVPRCYLRRQDLPALAAAVTGQDAGTLTPEAAARSLAELGDQSTEVEANLRALMRWEEANVMRISGEIPGTDPQLAEQTIVLFAYYDSASVVPALSPGAESACGVATMLEIAELLSKHPPRRKVKLVAAPGHFQALAGARDYAFDTVYPRREGADKDAKEGTGESYFFVGLDLSSRHSTFGAFYKANFYDQLTTQEVELQRSYSELSGLLAEWAGEAAAKGGAAKGLAYQSGIVPQQGRDWRSLLPDLMAFDSEVMSTCGYPGIALATTGDPRSSVNTPLDTYERLEPFLEGNVRGQAIGCAYLVKNIADVPVLPVDREKIWEKRQVGSLFGYAIELSQLAYMPKVAVPNAVAAVNMLAADVTTKAKSMTGVQTYDYRISNVQGYFEVFGLVKTKQFRVDGFLPSPTNGAVTKIATSELAEATDRLRESDWAERETDLRLSFIRSICTTIFDLTNPLNLRTLGRSTAVRGESNSELQYLVSFVGQESLDDPFSKPVAVFFTERDLRIKFLLASGAVGYEGLLLNFESEEAGDRKRERTGLGFKLDKSENFIYMTAMRVLEDMQLLNQERLERLRGTGIVKNMVQDLHEQAGNHLEAARRDLDARQYDRMYHNLLMGWGKANRVYPDVRDTGTDVVKGVVFYFALLLPFVLFTERLLINYVEIRRKLAAIAILFALSYLVLRLVHPAFKLSQTPVIILDGFLMLVASVGTIWYLLTKFSVVMEGLRQKIDMIHRADVARASAAMAAFVLGISNMRKRKVRTGLTAVTLILLTFTILSFTSFETVPNRLLDYASPRKAAYEGVLLRGLGWGPLSEFVSYDMMNFFEVRGMRVAPRSWFVNRKKSEDLQLELRRADGAEGEAVANAILGLSPEEAYFSKINDPRYLDHEWFDPSMPDWPFVCILPSRMKEGLRIEDREVGTARVSVLGRDLRVVGTFNSDEMFRYEDLDGEEITPADFVAQQYKQAAGGAAAQQAGAGGGALSATGEIDVETFVHRKSSKQEEEEQYIHMEPDRVLVVPNELNLKLGGTIRAIAAGPGVSSRAERVLRPFRQVLEELLGRVNLALYAAYGETADSEPVVHRVATRSRLSLGGVKGLVVPIMIAALIVFNTMLGAVYERIGEIKTYASVGLAPMHIGALFFAESCVFAVMGAMLGYLCGQVVSHVLKLMPTLLEGMSLNYSSISAVWSVVLVVVVVLASTAYPARMAGKLSVPDETRKMTIPKPTSDVWEIWFPFTVSSKEALGVMSYLREYFESNDEDAVGNFTADNLQFYAQEVDGARHLCLESDVWVAPLDMGVSQAVKISSIPDPDEGEITYLFFTITRKSGEFQTWHRMNLGFLKDLRKQLLIWRLVTPAAKQRLTKEAAELIEDRVGAGS